MELSVGRRAVLGAGSGRTGRGRFASVKSQAMLISWPPPIRMPLTRLTTGLSQGEDRRAMSLKSRMYWRY